MISISKKDMEAIQEIARQLYKTVGQDLQVNLILLAAFERFLISKGISPNFEVNYNPDQEFYDSLSED